jgi:hypothetical protein
MSFFFSTLPVYHPTLPCCFFFLRFFLSPVSSDVCFSRAKKINKKKKKNRSRDAVAVIFAHHRDTVQHSRNIWIGQQPNQDTAKSADASVFFLFLIFFIFAHQIVHSSRQLHVVFAQRIRRRRLPGAGRWQRLRIHSGNKNSTNCRQIKIPTRPGTASKALRLSAFFSLDILGIRRRRKRDAYHPISSTSLSSAYAVPLQIPQRENRHERERAAAAAAIVDYLIADSIVIVVVVVFRDLQYIFQQVVNGQAIEHHLWMLQPTVTTYKVQDLTRDQSEALRQRFRFVLLGATATSKS